MRKFWLLFISIFWISLAAALENEETGSLDKKTFLLFFILLMLVIIFLFVYLYEKKFKKKILSYLGDRKFFYKRRIRGLKSLKEKPRASLKMLKALSKKYFKEYLNLKNTLTFDEYAFKFEKRKKKSMEEFCRAMSQEMYSDARLKKEDIADLVNKFEKIVEEEEESNKDDINLIKELLKRGREEIKKGNKRKAKNLYEEIKGLYSGLEKEEKEKIEEEALKFYNDLVKTIK